jgi:ABC-type antimicrobial peptide transport system permease subunit
MIIKMHKRIFATTIGVALCVMYLVGTMSMVAGLHEGTEKVANMWGEGFLIVYNGYTLSESKIDIDTIDGLPGKYAACSLVIVNISSYESRVLALEDPHNILGGENITLIDEVLPGKDIDIINLTTLDIRSRYTSISLNITTKYKPYTSALFPDDWILASHDTIRLLNPELEDNYSFIVIPRENNEAIDFFNRNSYNIMQSVSVIKFFELGFYQIEANLWAIVVSSALIIIILIYNIMSIETKYRIPDIKIIKYLGSSQQLIIMVFLSQALFICGIGTIMGLALGIIAANAIVSMSQLLGFASVLVPQVTLYTITLPLLVAILAGLIGGFFPAYRASKTNIRSSREVL